MLLGGGDCDPIKYNNHSYEIYPPSKIKELEFDKVFTANMSDYQAEQIIQNLKDLGVSKEKIDLGVFGKVAKFAKLNFIKTLSMQFQEQDIKGAVAEFGVWRETARYINEFFKDDIFYLLDTFEGFDEKDISKEKGTAKKANTNDFSDTSLDFVKKQMLHLDKCHFIKGYFPESAAQISQDEKFKFVNIDVDLYQPILEGLKYFYPRMVKDGVILVHDYFHPYYTGTKKAVDEFCKNLNLKALPIGDAFSVMIVKN